MTFRVIQNNFLEIIFVPFYFMDERTDGSEKEKMFNVESAQ